MQWYKQQKWRLLKVKNFRTTKNPFTKPFRSFFSNFFKYFFWAGLFSCLFANGFFPISCPQRVFCGFLCLSGMFRWIRVSPLIFWIQHILQRIEKLLPIWRRNIFTVCQLLVPSASSQNAILCGRLRYVDAELINNVLVWLQTSKSGLFKLVHDLFLLFWCQYAIGCPASPLLH